MSNKPYLDSSYNSDEDERWVIIGETHRRRLVVVVHAEEAGTVRIISAREADKREREKYEEGTAMSRMKLYAHPFSNNSMRPQLSLEEKHLDYDYMKVDLFKGEHKQPEYLAINPRGQVPALVDGDVRIYESVAIVEYLERRYPEPCLIPSEPKAMATCFRLIGEFNQKLDPTNIFFSVKFGGKRRADLGDRIDKLLAECRIWEGYVGDGPYFTGQDFSIADIVVLPFFGTIIDGLGLPKADYPKLHAWYERCKSRPSVAKLPWFEVFAGEKKNLDQHVLAKPAG